jgi:hypothetical protein
MHHLRSQGRATSGHRDQRVRDVVDGAAVRPVDRQHLLASGAWSRTSTTGFSPSPPSTTKIAGRFGVGPPRGISATARCLPGASPSVTGRGRAALAGAATALAALTSVPSSVGRAGWYWPDGHQAQARTATSAAVAV